MNRHAWFGLLALASCVGGDPQTTGGPPVGSGASGDAGGATTQDAAGLSPLDPTDAGDAGNVTLPWFERPNEATATPNGGNAGTVAARDGRRVYGFLASDSKRAFVRWLDDRGAPRGEQVFASDAQLGLTGIVLDDEGNTYLSFALRGSLSGGPLPSPIEPRRKSDTGSVAGECLVMRLEADTHALKWTRSYAVSANVTGHSFHSATCRVTDVMNGSVLVVGSYTSSRIAFEGGSPGGTPVEDGGDHADAGSPSSSSQQDGFVGIINALGASSVKLRAFKASATSFAMVFDGRFAAPPSKVSVVGWTTAATVRQASVDVLDRKSEPGTGGFLFDVDLDDATKTTIESFELTTGVTRAVFPEKIARNANGIFVAGRARSDEEGDQLRGGAGGPTVAIEGVTTFLFRRSGAIRQLVAAEGGESQVGRLDLATADDGAVVALLPQLGAIDLGASCVAPAKTVKSTALVTFAGGDLAACTRLQSFDPFAIHGLALTTGRASISGAHGGALDFGGPATFPPAGGTNVFRPFLVELAR